MKALSINLRIAHRLVVVVGGGRVAARRASTFLSAGARVRMIAPKFSAEAHALADPQLTRVDRNYENGDLADAFLVLAATNDAKVNAAICADAHEAQILCSNAADPDAGNFTLPAAAHHGNVTIAVDTAGASPELSKKILKQLGSALDRHAGAAAETLAIMRAHTFAIAETNQRRRLRREFANLPLDMLASLSADEARSYVETALSGAQIDSHSSSTVTCASRGSRLALTQTSSVTSALENAGIKSEILTIATHADLTPNQPLSAMNAENVFVKEIEAALMDGRADYAVHSCKDLPSTLDPALQLVAISAREDPRDAFCSERFASFYDLPSNARVGTSSVRRRAQLMCLRADLEYVDCRGNVDTRLRKLRDGQFDALVLATAGMARLGATSSTVVAFEPEEIVPAVGQGALAIEMRRGESDLHAMIRQTINDRRAELEIVCERAALATLGGGCKAPIGIHAEHRDAGLIVHGIVCSHDGSQTVTARASAVVETPVQSAALGERLASQLLISGAAQLLRSASGIGLPLAGRVIVLPRTQMRESRIAPALERCGARILQVHSAEEALQVFGEQTVDMVVFASSAAVDTVGEMFPTWRVDATRPAIATMGEHSAEAVAARGVAADVIAGEPSVESLVDAVQRYFRHEVTVR
ncbi:MAG: hydroxymethylbilane synthase [Candidatus Eremiobacteraeota bacterium]|nr:hydroxymethylbilane synthase [Candidatus Eremiobacteraeota bacterium]